MQSWRFLAPVQVWANIRSSRWPRKPLFRTGQTVAMQCSPCVFLLLCGFWQFSAPAVGRGSLKSVPARRSQCNAVFAFCFALVRVSAIFHCWPLAAEAFIPHWPDGHSAMQSLHFLAPAQVWAILGFSRWPRKPLFRAGQTVAVHCRILALSSSCAALGHSPLQPLAAEALGPHRPNGRRVLPFSCSCAGWGHSLLQPLATAAFIPHRPNSHSAMQSLRFPDPVRVGAIPRSRRWPRKPETRTGQTVAAQCSPCVFLLLCGIGPFSAQAVGRGSLYSLLAKRSQCNAVLALSCSCAALGHSPLQPLAAEAFTPHRQNGHSAMQSLLFFAPVSVWAILRSSRWPRKPLLRTGPTVAMQGNPRAFLLL